MLSSPLAKLSLIVFFFVVAACHKPIAPSATCSDWPQFGQSSAHNGATCATAQTPTAILADQTYDPFVAAVTSDNAGLIVHYQSPLVIGSDLYLEKKSGTYVPCGTTKPAGCGAASWDQEVWNEAHFTIAANGKLTAGWSFASDWKPEPQAGFEPVFHAALSGAFIYVPGASGSVHQLDRETGAEVAHLAPFGADANTYVSGPIAVDASGSVYYNALVLDPTNPWTADIGGAWLVKISAKGAITKVSYSVLVPNAPASSAPCTIGYSTKDTPLPWPPLDGENHVLPAPTTACLSQRPSVNVVPAIAADGTIYTVSRAHGSEYYSYLVAVTPQLTPKWASSLRVLNDGCGVLRPTDSCTIGAPTGVDPNTGEIAAGSADDSSSSTPEILPDGNILYGAFSLYNGYRGHLMKFSPAGVFLKSFDFGWDITPAVFAHDGTYSLITKDNVYSQDKYGVDNGSYSLARLDADLNVEWKFQSTNTMSCTRDAQGTPQCVSDHPTGFEWCVNAPAVDKAGTVYANSEDGALYEIDVNGAQKATLFLDQALGAAYTPIALDHAGHVLALNAGHLLIVGTR